MGLDLKTLKYVRGLFSLCSDNSIMTIAYGMLEQAIQREESKPVKTIDDMTDEELIEIAKLGVGELEYYGKATVRKKVDFRGWKGADVSFWFGGHDGVGFYIDYKLNIHTDEGWGIYNMYKIYELLREWGIKPTE